jgi:6-phosphogluconolactonase (cycloisomerase 2 family)
MPPIIEEDIVEMAEVTSSVNVQRDKDKRRKRKRSLSAAIVMLVVALIGCGQFFVPPTSGGGSTGNNRVYLANSTTSSLSGFTIGTNTLSAVSGSPVSLGYVPVAAVVTPNNNFIYVAGPTAIYMYTINSDGSLTASSSGAAQVVASVVSLDVSPDGQWLFGLDNNQLVVDEYQINSSTGALTALTPSPYTVPTGTVVQKQVKVAPTGNLVFIALGTGGDIVFTLNTSTGVLAQSQTLGPVSATTSDNAFAIDSTTSYLYIARTGTSGGLAVYTIGAAGKLDQITGSPFATGNQANSVVIDSTGKYVYVANRGDGTITGFSIGTGSALTALSGSPYASGSGVTSLGVDKSGKYLLAGANGGSPDLSMYSYDATTLGKLNLATSAASGTQPAGVVAIALTH